MKTLLTLSLLVLFVVTMSAQIPNAGFENWTSGGSYETPDLWGNLNPSTAAHNVYTVTKGTSGPASGVAYIKLMTKDVGGTITPGIIVCGKVDEITLKPLSGIPFSGRPEKLIGKWQYMGYGTDAATFGGWLTKWNTQVHTRDTIAILTGNTSGMLHSWGDFSFPFTYRSAAIPDTLVLLISSSSAIPVKNSFIWIDDLAFDGTATSVESIQSKPELTIYPNPASQFVKITFMNSGAEKATFILNDNIGNRILELTADLNPGMNTIQIDLTSSKIHSGMYFLQMQIPSGNFARKLVIKK